MSTEKQALAGKKCLVMRHPSQANSFIAELEKFGAQPVLVPLISFRKTELSKGEGAVLNRLPEYDWFVFTSQNGVKYFLEQLSERGKGFPERVKVAAVGKKTGDYLLKRGIDVHFVPEHFTGDQLAGEMKKYFRPGDHLCIVKGNLARDVVRREAEKLGVVVDEIIVYETFFPVENQGMLLKELRNLHDGILIFTSPSTVTHFYQILTEHGETNLLKGKWVAAIGPVTKKALDRLGIPVHICPDEYTGEGLIREMVLTFTKSPHHPD